MNISIFASIGAQNLGDELILKNEIELLKGEFGSSLCPSDIPLDKGDESRFPSSKGQGELSKAQERDTLGCIPAKQEGELFFRVASYCPHNPVFQLVNTQYFEYFPIGIKNPKNIFRNIKNFLKFFRVILWSDIVVIGGGGIIYDSELQSVGSPLKQWLFRARVARCFRKKIYFYAVGIDIKNQENLRILGKIFKKAWKITVRDKKSQQQLNELGITSELVDDPVMNEEREKGNILGTHSSKNFRLQDFETYDFQGKKVGLALRRGYIGRSGDIRVEKLLIEELCQFIEKKGGKIIFLPHSLHETDMRANDYQFMKQFLSYDREIYVSLGEVYTAYNHKMLDIVVSMRLHSIILSYVYGIDQIVLSYSQKTQQVIKKLTK